MDCIAIDSNALTYFIQVMEPDYDPSCDDPKMAVERVSMIRLLLYVCDGEPFIVLPSVKAEYLRITSREWRRLHKETVMILLDDPPYKIPKEERNRLIEEFIKVHPKRKDCQILAEACLTRMKVLLSCDSDFISRLGTLLETPRIVRPSEFWTENNIAPGTRPRSVPAKSNPLFQKSWWKV